MRCELDCTSLGQSNATFEVLTVETRCGLFEMDSVSFELGFLITILLFFVSK